MRKFYILFLTVFISVNSFGQITINEIFEDDPDPGFIEINGPELYTIPTGWEIRIYDDNLDILGTIDLGGQSIPAELDPPADGNSLLAIATNLLLDKCYILLVKNADTTDPIGIELFGTGGGVGSGTILGIPATGLGNAPNNQSHQLSDAGWVTGTPSPGALNTGQSTLPVVKNEIEEFALYPNPVTNGQLFLSSRDRNDKQVEIYAWTGQQVFSEKVQSKETINISNLNRGIYMVRVYEEGKIATRKLIVN